MKNFFIAALLVISVSASAFKADPYKISSAVLHSFNADFDKADNVVWLLRDNYVKAAFTFNNQRMEAFYNHSGELIGTSRAITLEELPVRAKRTFAKKYPDYIVKEAIRFDGTSDGAYYISAENDEHAVILKVEDGGAVSTFQRTRK